MTLVGQTAALVLFGLLAMHTGKSKVGTSVTGKLVVQCEYQLGGQKFWKTFQGSVCPPSIDVE